MLQGLIIGVHVRLLASLASPLGGELWSNPGHPGQRIAVLYGGCEPVLWVSCALRRGRFQ